MVSDRDKSFNVVYTAETINFTPDINIQVPRFDGATPGTSAFVGASLQLDIMPAANPGLTCSPAVSLTYTVADSGLLETSAPDPVLVDRPAGENTNRCVYDITLPSSVVVGSRTLNLRDGAPTRINGDLNTIASLNYQINASYDYDFDLDFSIVVPTYNGDEDPATALDESTQNAFTGALINVQVAPDTAAGAPTDCTTIAGDWEVGPTGAVTGNGGNPVTLLGGVPGETGKCTYTATFAQNEQGGANKLVRQGSMTRSVDEDTTAFEVEYHAAVTRFTPNVMLVVPYSDDEAPSNENDLSGTQITINYAPLDNPAQDSGCDTTESDVFEIGIGGTAVAGGMATRTTTASLVDYPSGVNVRCRYVATPVAPITVSASVELVLATASTVEFANRDPIAVEYSSDTYFPLALDITVPDIARYGQSGTNFFAGETIPVNYAPVAGSHPRCSAAGSFGYVVQGDRSVAPPGGRAALVDVPQNEANGCSYTVTFEPTVSSADGATPIWTLTNQDTSSVTLSAAAASASREYRVGEIRFVPAVNITVPPINHVGTANVFAGTSFVVSFGDGTGVTDAGGANACSTGIASLTYTVQSDGMATTAGTPPQLVDRAAGDLASRCTYAVDTPMSAMSDGGAELSWVLTRQSGHTASVGSDVVDVAVDYSHETAITFSPQIAISVPPYNGDDDPATDPLDESDQNWFTGEELSVAIARSGGPASNCSPDASLTYTVQPDGSVTTATDPVLVDYPAGLSQRCVYSVTYPPNEVGGTVLARQTAGLDTETKADARASGATYHARLTFAPDVEFTLPFIDSNSDDNNDLSGVEINVTYNLLETNPAQDSGCSGFGVAMNMAASEIWTIGTGGSAADGGMAAITGSNTAATLVDRPAGVSERCRYVADFANTIATSTPVSLTVSSGDGTVFAGNDGLDVVYSAGTPFNVDITLRVPQFDRDGMAGTNFFAGVVIPVTFTKASGPGGCIESSSADYVVQTDGTVMPRGGTVSLIGLPLDETENCVYLAEFEREVSSAPGASPVWTLTIQGAATQSVSAAAATVERDYHSGDLGFLPDVSIMVPDIDGRASGVSLFTGASFRVNFNPAETGMGCSPPDVAVFTVGNNGMVTGTAPSLTDRPTGRNNRCSYTVRFPSSASSVAGAELSWRLGRQAGFGTSVRALANSVSASYALNRDVAFMVSVDIDVPQYNGDGERSGSNAFTGLSFEVGFAPTAGSPSGCPTRSETYTVQADGRVTGAQNIVLLDRPRQAASSRCVYTVTMPPGPVSGAGAGAGVGLERQPGATASVQADSASLVVSGSYRALETTFTPAVSAAVEMLDEDRNGLHDLAGVTLEVGYAGISDAPPAGCTESASEVYVVGTDGTASLAQPPVVEQPQSPVSLVDRPAGSVARCGYVVSYPTEIAPGVPLRSVAGSAAGTATGSAAGTATGSAAAGTATARISAGQDLSLTYAKPPPPRVIPGPVPLMSANVGVSRLPVRVTVEVPLGNFETDETFEVLVSVPGACGSDTFLFGGVAGSIGVAYAAEAIIRGVAVVVGEDTPHFNPQASYDLPPYVNGAGGRESCAVRVTVLEVPQGCSLAGASGVDFRGRAYIQADWSPGVNSFDLAATYDCPGFVEQPERETQSSLTLRRGWLTLPFNGETGTTPAELLRKLGGAVSSMWLWDAASQSWVGWTARHGNLGLASLTRGDVIMAYAHLDITINYSPGDLLALPDGSGGLRLQNGFNLHIFGGDQQTSVASLVRQPSVVPVVFLWDTAAQNWRYHLPGRQPIAGFEIPWFDTLNPGDTVFIYNLSPQPTTIAWG